MMENTTILLGSRASLHVYRPARPAAPLAAIIVPGGSYRPGPFGWCKTAEGSDIARQLAREGITGIVLHYRLPAGRPHVPMQNFTHTNSKLEDLGAQPSEALEIAYSADRQVTDDSVDPRAR